MVAIAVLCSWVGAVLEHCQPEAAPTVILGPLIVFETLAGLFYTFLMRQSVPPLLTACGIALLVVGVVIAVRAKPEKTDGRSGVGGVSFSPSGASLAGAYNNRRPGGEAPPAQYQNVSQFASEPPRRLRFRCIVLTGAAFTAWLRVILNTATASFRRAA